MRLASIGQLYEAGDWQEIAARLCCRFDVEIDHEALRARVAEIAKRFKGGAIGPCWSDCTWLMFLKNRVAELSRFPSGERKESAQETTAVLHVFFLYLEETPQMLSRLRNERKQESQVPRTKLTKSNPQFVEPIDSAAAKVVFQ